MRIITPAEVAGQTQNKYLGVLVAAKFARYVNDFPRDRSVDWEEKLTTRAFDELVRFRAHVDAARAALKCDQPVGKQLGFLAQELLREVNTMGSKANDARITQTVIAMKGDLEKFREQLENLE